MGTSTEARLRRLEASAQAKPALLFIIAADNEEAEHRLAELRLTREDVTIIITGVHRAYRGPPQ